MIFLSQRKVLIVFFLGSFSFQFSFENAAVYIVFLGALSFCVGIYCLEIFYKMTQSILPGYYICSKYYILQALFVITRFHVLSFDALGNNGYLPCRPPVSSFTFGLCKCPTIANT